MLPLSVSSSKTPPAYFIYPLFSLETKSRKGGKGIRWRLRSCSPKNDARFIVSSHKMWSALENSSRNSTQVLKTLCQNTLITESVNVETYSSDNSFPLHLFVTIYGHIHECPREWLGSCIPAFLYSNCFLLHMPNGNSTSLHILSRFRPHSVIISGRPLPFHGLTVYDPLSNITIPLARTSAMWFFKDDPYSRNRL